MLWNGSLLQSISPELLNRYSIVETERLVPKWIWNYWCMDVILYINRVVTTFIESHSFGPNATKLGTEVPKRVAGGTVKQKVWRAHYFKIHGKQKEKQPPGIECTTQSSLSERSILRASVHSTVSMGICYSGRTIEHDHHPVADSGGLQEFRLVV